MRSRFFSFQSQREFTSCLYCSAQLCLSQQTAALRGQLLAAVTTLPRNARSEPESHCTTASARAQPPTGKQDSKSWSWMPPCLLHLLLFQCPTPLTSPCPLFTLGATRQLPAGDSTHRRHSQRLSSSMQSTKPAAKVFLELKDVP